MANTLTTQIILDGPRNTVVKVVGVLDTSDLTSTVIVDPATLTGMDNTGTLKAKKLKIVNVTHNVEDGLSVAMFWDATTPDRILDLVGRNELEFKRFAGLIDPTTVGSTGKITISTQGWAAAAVLSFSIVLELTKQQNI